MLRNVFFRSNQMQKDTKLLELARATFFMHFISTLHKGSLFLEQGPMITKRKTSSQEYEEAVK